MAIEERDAFQLFQTLETLPEDMRPRAAGVLADYRNQQTAAGLPLWPSQEAARADKRKRVYEVFDNPLTLDKDDGSFIQADRVQPGLGDTLRKREASIMWLANRYGADEMDVRNRLDLYKADASQKWGAGLLDDSAFFSRAKAEIDTERKKADDVKLASMTGMESSLWGGDGFAEASKFQASKPDASPDEQDAFWRSFNEFNAVLEPRRDMVKKATEAMRRTQQGEASDADKATMEELTWAMTEATGKEREIMKRAVVLGARKVAEEGKRGVGGTFTGSASNLIESMFGGARRGEQIAREFDPTQPQPVGPVKTVQDALKAMDTMSRAQFSEQVPYDPDAPTLPEARVLTTEEQKLFTEAKAKVKDLFKVERELKKIALMTDPMDDSVLGTMASGTASTLTLALPLAMGPQGILMAAGGYANMEKEELLTEYPDMQPEDATKVAVLSGGLQAVMDKAQLFGLGKFAPNVRKMLTEGMTRELVKRAIAQGGATFVFENIVEAAQDLTTPVVQQLVSDLSESVPGVDWQKEFKEFAGSRLDVAIGMLPLMLIGAGANTAMDRDSILTLLADDKALAEAGFVQDDRVAILDLARKGKAEDAQARLQEAMARRSPELAAEMGNEKEADIINAEKVLQKAIDDGILPRARKVERGADGWIVEDTITGDVVKVPTREEAIKLTFGHLDDQEQRRAQAGAQLWDELYEKGGMGDEALRAESASMDTQKQAARSPEDAARVARAIETYAQLHGIPLDEARKIVFTVNGFNRDEQIENVRTAVSNVFGRGMNVGTVLHEATHGRWRAALESGRLTHDQGVAWVRLAEQATGIDFLPSKDDAQISESMLDEAIVDVTVADAIGRRKDGGKFSAGLISRGMAALARGERNATLGKDIDSRKASRDAGTFATWLKAWKEFWGQVIQKGKALRKAKAEGKLGEDYDAFLDKLMEASPQRRHEAAAAKEALEIAQEGNMPFSLSPRIVDGNFFANENSFYRVVQGDDALSDILQSGEVRTNAAEKIKSGMTLAEKMAARPTAFPSFSKGSASMSYAAENPNHSIIVTNDDSLQPSTSGRHSVGKTHFPTINGVHQKSLSGDNFQVYRHLGDGKYELVFENGAKVSQAGNMAFSLAPMPEAQRKEFAVEAFHGTDSNRFDEFDISKLASGTGNEGLFSAGFYFSPNKDDASDYGKNLMSVKLRVKNPLTVPDSMPVMMRGDDSADYWTAFDAQMKGALKSVFSANDFNEVDRVDSIQMDETFVGSFSRAYKALSGVSLPPSKAAEVSAVLIQKAGFDAVYAVDDTGKSTEIVVYDPKNVLIEKFNGKPVSGASFSLAPKEQDTEYLAAVESGDLAKAQAVVDEAANAAGYDSETLFRGRQDAGNIVAFGKDGAHFTPDREYAEGYAEGESGNVVSGRAKINKPLHIDSALVESVSFDDFRNHLANQGLPLSTPATLFAWSQNPKYNQTKTIGEAIDAIESDSTWADFQEDPSSSFTDNLGGAIWPLGFDAIRTLEHGDRDLPVVILRDPSQIKSADPVTRDESGQVIPLSQRFNPESNDIRFSLAPRSLPEVADTILAAQMKKPAFFEAFVTLARRKMEKLWKDGDWRVDKRGIASKRVGFDSRMAGVRSTENIEAERKFRLRSRQRELIDEGMLALPPATLAAYDQGVASLADVPIVKDMLGKVGKIMSKGAAQKSGKLKTDGKGSAGDYDGAPRLPPAWYAKSGGSMPYEIAQQLSDMGHLKDAYADTLWEALRSAIYSTRTANEAFKKARDAVRKVETDALAQAKKETDTWAKDETAKIPTEKERQMMALRTLDAILSAFPPEIRAKVGGFVKLASFSTDAAREAEIIRRLAKLEEVIEEEAKKHYAAKIGKMIDRYKSQKDSSGRISGKLISTATEQVDYAATVAGLDVAAQAEKGDALESLIEKSDDADVVQDALNKLGILRMFETMGLKDSLALESAADWLETTIADGKLGKKIVDEARKEFVDDMREQAQAQVLDGKALNIDDANNLTNVNRAPMLAMVQRLRGMMSEALWTTAQRLEIIFGEGSKASEYFAAQAVAAANKSNDIKRAVSAQQREILGVIFGSESKFTHAKGIAKLQKPRLSGVMVRRPVTKDITLDMETLTKLADGTMTPETAGIREDELQTAMDEWAASDRKRSVTITQVVNVGTETDRYMSELQGIQWRLWWNQADSKKQMERDGWSDESIKQLDAFLSDEAKALGMWISDSYGEAAKMIDPVYRRLFNAPLPRIKGYAPIYRMTLSTSADVMDLGNSDMNSGLAAGFTKSRVNTTAPLLEIDALAAFLSHWENVSHWVSHAELMRDMKAILLDKNVSTAIRQKKGDGALSRLKKDISSIETNGTKGAAEIASISKGWSWLMQYRAFKALSFRVSPIAKQTAAALNPLLADVPAHNYAAGLSRAFTSPQEFAADVAAMWKSDVVQRRIDGGFSAEARIAQQGASMTGSQAIVFMQAGMLPMAHVDAGWTAMGAAVAFDYYKRSFLSQNAGATVEMADAHATARLERMIATSAQPADIVNRSLIERSGNIFARSMSMFVSEQRKALAIEALAIRKLATGKSKNKAMDVQRILVAHFVQSAITQCVAMFLASTLGDDEDEDREWSVKQWALSLSLGPISGLFLVGRGIESIARRMLGLRIFPNNDLAGKAADDLIRGTKSMDELFNPDDAEDVMTSLDALSAAAGSVGSGLFGPAAGAVDVSANLVREGIKITKALAEED